VWTPHGTITPEEPRVRPVPVSLTVNEEPDTVAVAFCLAVQDVAIPSWIVKIWPPESLMVVPALNCCAEENTSLLELDVVSTVPEPRSEEHTSELQSRSDRVCRLLLEKKHN